MGGCFGNHWVDRQIENDLFRHLEEQDEQYFECVVCGEPIDHEGTCGSKDCIKTDNEN